MLAASDARPCVFDLGFAGTQILFHSPLPPFDYLNAKDSLCRGGSASSYQRVMIFEQCWRIMFRQISVWGEHEKEEVHGYCGRRTAAGADQPAGGS